MRIAFIRVSTEQQNIDRQWDRLESISDELYIERVSAVSKHRPVYDKVIKRLKKHDTLVVLDLDRVWRSTIDALTEVEKLQKRGIELEIVNLSVDTKTPPGRFFFTVIAALAAFEREMLSARTKQGMEAARKRGKKIGRPRKLTYEQITAAQEMVADGQISITKLAKEYGCSRDTLSKALNGKP